MLPCKMKCDKLLKLVKKHGWYEVRQKGSHKIMAKDGETHKLVIPYHIGKEVPTGTCNKILKQAGIK